MPINYEDDELDDQQDEATTKTYGTKEIWISPEKIRKKGKQLEIAK